MNDNWTPYVKRVRRAVQMRPVTKDEIEKGLDPRISVSKHDRSIGSPKGYIRSPKEGDMVARNTENLQAMWLVSKEYFEKNYERLVNFGDPDEFKVPNELVNSEGYPTEAWLKAIRDYHPSVMPIAEFVELLRDSWNYDERGFNMERLPSGEMKLELHTSGWSGNEDMIAAIKSNYHLTNNVMKFYKWKTGGHFEFLIYPEKKWRK